jgi:hypothetical protein
MVLAYGMVEEGRADLGVERGKIVLRPNKAVEAFVPSLRQYPGILNNRFIIHLGYGWFVGGFLPTLPLFSYPSLKGPSL